MIETNNVFSENQSSAKKDDDKNKGLKQPNTQPQAEFIDSISNEKNGPKDPASKEDEKNKPEVDKDSDKGTNKPEISEDNNEDNIDNPKGDDNYPGTQDDDKFYLRDE